MKYIDIHCHLDREDYGADMDQVLARMREREVEAITIGADLESSKRAVEIANENDEVWACLGVHPEHVTSPRSDIHRSDPLLDAGEGGNSSLPLHLGEGQLAEGEWDEVFLEFEKLVKSPKVVGIGECGLDYFRQNDEQTKNIQKDLFEKQIQFALKHDKPLMLHIRASKNSFDAYDDALEILKNYPMVRGNVHFFAGDTEIARKFLDLEFTLSFTGVITFTNDYDEVIKYIPQNSIMSETDAPFVAPVPYRGQHNEPSFVIEVVKRLAEIRGEDLEPLNNAILANAKRVFGI